MQKLSFPVRVILLFTFSTFIASCSSSTYSEKYNDSNSYKNYNLSGLNINNDRKEVFNSLVRILNLANTTNPKKIKLLAELVNYLDTPYQYGGNSKRGIDCSALTQQVINKSVGIKLPRTAREQFTIGKKIKDINKLKFGDLIYFDTSNIYYPGHVGIYLGKSLFAHASTSKGVIISTLENTYYSSKFVGASRLKAKKY